MYRIAASILLFMAFSAACDANIQELRLSCAISASNYPDYSDGHLFESIQLSGPKHEKGGSYKLLDWDKHEFWVMSHTIQYKADSTSVLNFQVAIKNKTTGEFTHALSQTNDHLPASARISLISYEGEGFWESGEIMFECKTSEE